MYELLIELLVATALVDKSAPPCWRTNEVLGAIERLVMVARGQYAEFADISMAALKELGEQGDPEVRTLIKLAVLNGRRRDDTEDMTFIQRLFDKVKEDIGKLEEGPRKQRCYTFFLYQQEIFGSRCGFYAEAAQSAEAAAALHTEPDKKAISMYIAKVYAMWAAVVTGAELVIDEAFAALKAELPRLQHGVAGTALEIQWGRGNGPIHLLQAMILANIQDKALFDTHMTTVLDNADKFGNAYKPFICVLLAQQYFQNSRNEDAIVCMYDNVINSTSSSLAEKAWAHLILARAQSWLNPAGAAKDYREITAVPDAHMVAAVAARELAQLQK